MKPKVPGTDPLNRSLFFDSTSVKTGSMLVHTVYFYLKPEVSEEETAAFIKRVEGLGAIETIDSIYIGTPAATPVRPVVKNDYSVALTVIFKTMADHDVYQDHPVHTDFIENNKDLWANVVIYDAD